MHELISRIEKSFTGLIWTAVVILTCYCICKCLYNLYLHPLSNFPGPKLAAIGSLYEFYYDVIKDGTFIWEVEMMHRKYGPVIRVNAEELHVKDSQYYGNIYTGGGRRVNKDAATVRAFGMPKSVVATVDHELHRKRRAYLNPYYSKRSISDLEPVIHERIGKLCLRLEEAMHEGQVIKLGSAFSALTADIISFHFYGQHFDYLGIKDFKFAITDAMLGISDSYNLARFLPDLVTTIKRLPISILKMILPSLADLLNMQEEIKHKTLASLDKASMMESKSVLLRALRDPNIPTKERNIDHMLDEGLLIIFAGTETTSRALSVAMCHLLNNKSLVMRLRNELDTLPLTQDNTYSLSQLELLPFLTGIVNESLRLSFGPISRLPRVATDETLKYKDFLIPPGTPVSQSTYFVHTDPSIFPDPHTFDPERWIKAGQEGVSLNRFLVSFSKGGRQCLGIGLAYTELYLTIARVARGFDMELYETTLEDIEFYHARIVGYPKKIKGQAPGRGEVEIKVTRRIK